MVRVSVCPFQMASNRTLMTFPLRFLASRRLLPNEVVFLVMFRVPAYYRLVTPTVG